MVCLASYRVILELPSGLAIQTVSAVLEINKPDRTVHSLLDEAKVHKISSAPRREAKTQSK